MFAEDLTVFFDTTTGFATPATLAGGGMVPVIFDAAYQGGLNDLIESTGPSAKGSTASLATVVQGTGITINAIAYKVASVEPDGTGVTTLLLELA